MQNKTKINKKELDSINYLKKYKKRALFESIKVWFLNYFIKNIFLVFIAFIICFVFYKTIKWEAVLYDYHNKVGLIFGDKNNADKETFTDITNELNKKDQLESVELPLIVNNISATTSQIVDKNIIIEDNDKQKFLKRLIHLLNDKAILVNQIEIMDYQDVKFYLNNDMIIKFNLTQNVDDIITNILFIYKDEKANKIITNKNKNIEYIDMRFGDKIFYKEKNIFDQKTLASSSDLKINEVDVIIPR